MLAWLTFLQPISLSVMRRVQVFALVSHIPGHRNELADALSRFKSDFPVPVQDAHETVVSWRSLVKSPGIVIAQDGRKWPKHFDVISGKSMLLAPRWSLFS